MIQMSFKREMDRVAELSGGRLVIKTYGGGELFPANKEHDAIDKDLLDRTNASTIWWKDRWVEAPLFNYTVGGLRPIEFMLWMMRGGNDMLQELIKDTPRIVFPGWTGSPEIFLTTTKELKSLADIKGLRIRTGGDDGVLFTKMGAAVVQVPPGEVYESTKRGVIDAFQLSCPAVDQSYKVYEVAKFVYISDVRQPSEYFTPVVNKNSFAKLPDDLKAIVKAASLEEGWRYLAEVTALDAKAVEFYKQYGVKIAPAPKDIVDEIQKQAQIYYDEQAAKSPFFAKVIKSQRDFAAEYRALYPAGL
jgi:TRAP-type mannitol/chloroaromatic compound transport system substrate-binding protein